MRYYNYDELYHYGILGMKWGVRRFQYKDGSLTSEGRKRYGVSDVAKKIGSGAAAAGRGVAKVSKAVGKGVAKATTGTAKAIGNAGKATYNANKKRIIKSGDLNTVYRNKNLLSNEELAQAISRVRAEEAMRSMRKNPFVSFGNTVNKVLDFGIGTIKTFEKIKTGKQMFQDLMGNKSVDFTKISSEEAMENINSGKWGEKTLKRWNEFMNAKNNARKNAKDYDDFDTDYEDEFRSLNPAEAVTKMKEQKWSSAKIKKYGEWLDLNSNTQKKTEDAVKSSKTKRDFSDVDPAEAFKKMIDDKWTDDEIEEYTKTLNRRENLKNAADKASGAKKYDFTDLSPEEAVQKMMEEKWSDEKIDAYNVRLNRMVNIKNKSNDWSGKSKDKGKSKDTDAEDASKDGLGKDADKEGTDVDADREGLGDDSRSEDIRSDSESEESRRPPRRVPKDVPSEAEMDSRETEEHAERGHTEAEKISHFFEYGFSDVDSEWYIEI